MRILLDTHVALWALIDSPRLSDVARALILDSSNELFFSAASVWEIAIKHSLSRKNMPVSGEESVVLFREAGFTELPVTSLHASATETLPIHHNDPFDRLLVAQSIMEPLRLLTHDRILCRYGNTVQFV